ESGTGMNGLGLITRLKRGTFIQGLYLELAMEKIHARKYTKNYQKTGHKKPEPTVAVHSHLSKSWTMPVPEIKASISYGMTVSRCLHFPVYSRFYFIGEGMNLWDT
ncbi:22907_t:CDS:2, partial [Gigaspora rosea]